MTRQRSRARMWSTMRDIGAQAAEASQWGTVAGMITAVATLLTALGGILVTVKVLVPNFRTNKKTLHIVNQEATDGRNYRAALIKALEKAGVEVPADQSKADTSGTDDTSGS